MNLLIQDMITVVCGTNRPNNFTQRVAAAYCSLIREEGGSCIRVSLEELPADFVLNNEANGNSSLGFDAFVKKCFEGGKRMVLVTPEYNGSFPGVCKAFIDSVSPTRFSGRKVALVGVSSGRAGNVRGMDHLTNILNYMGAVVLPYKVPVSRIETMLDEAGKVSDTETTEALRTQIKMFLGF